MSQATAMYRFPDGVGLWVVANDETDQVHRANFYDPAQGPIAPLPPPAK